MLETRHMQLLHAGSFSSVYSAGEAEGHGAAGKVVKAYHRAPLQSRHWLNISREVAILTRLKQLGVPGVVELCGTWDDAAALYLVFEPCPGGDLYKRLAHAGLLSEAQLCREVIVPLLRVLSRLHSLGVVHRDVKPENIFFDASGRLVLGDFGLAICRATDRPVSRVGTLDYMAPEVLAQPCADVVALRRLRPGQLPCYDAKVDVWALGVLVYEALMGITPFGHPDPETASLQAQFRRPAPLRPGVSAACADFVGRALTKQAAARPSAAQLLAHPWVQAHMTADDAAECRAATAAWCARGAACARALRRARLRRAAPRRRRAPRAAPASRTRAAPRPAPRAAPTPAAPQSLAPPSVAAEAAELLRQQQAAAAAAAAQRPWQRLVQQHRQQHPGRPPAGAGACPGGGAPPCPQACGASPCAPGPGHHSLLGRSCSALLDSHHALLDSARMASAVTGDAAGRRRCGQQHARGAQGAAALLGGSASAPAPGALCSSVPASPVTDRANPALWLLSPQQPARQYAGGGARQPAILAALYSPAPLLSAAQTPRRPVPGAHALAASPGQAPVPVLLVAPRADWQPLAVAAGSPLVSSFCAPGVQLVSPCRGAAPAPGGSPGQPPRCALVRHASAGLLPMRQQPGWPAPGGGGRQPAGVVARSLLQDKQWLLRPSRQPGASGSTAADSGCTAPLGCTPSSSLGGDEGSGSACGGSSCGSPRSCSTCSSDLAGAALLAHDCCVSLAVAPHASADAAAAAAHGAKGGAAGLVGAESTASNDLSGLGVLLDASLNVRGPAAASQGPAACPAPAVAARQPHDGAPPSKRAAHGASLWSKVRALTKGHLARQKQLAKQQQAQSTA
ncbi:Aurka [Scenedesmus sp. PABB004]|nr:Aurka [Scenedesmus sp. PABB004]